MVKNIYYNNKSLEKSLEIKKFSHLNDLSQKKNVDINRLLNRVKVDQQSEKLKNFIFISLGILLLGLMGTFVLIVR